jgi:two-component system CitB family sensor kinase
MAPVYPPRGERVLGFVSVQRPYPGAPGGLAAAAPNLLTYLGLASALGIGGSLLVARRVKRQTLGLEPAEIAGLVEHRDAMLHGIREGVVGLDLRGRVTLVNDEAIRLLRIPDDALGRTLEDLGVAEEVRAALLSTGVERDRPVGSTGRVLVVNRLPLTSGGARWGRWPRCATAPSCWTCAASWSSPGTSPTPCARRPTSSTTDCTPSPA